MTKVKFSYYDNKYIKSGESMVVTHGEYDNCEIANVYIAIIDFELEQQFGNFIEENEILEVREGFSYFSGSVCFCVKGKSFDEYLEEKGFIKKTIHHENDFDNVWCEKS